MTRTPFACLFLLLIWPLGGCPQEQDSTPDLPQALDANIEAPEAAQVGEEIELRARVRDAAGAVEYRWHQTFGRAVTVEGADSAALRFRAPSIATEQAVRFRVDVRSGERAGQAEASVRIAADAGFVGGPRPDDGAAGVEDDPNQAPTDDEDDLKPQVRLVTSLGDIVVELDRERAPITVKNFLQYVDDGFYEDTLFHRVIAGFVVQGGGFEPGLVRKEPGDPIENESDNGLRNDRGTIAMARTSAPDSATSQFYFNLVDNSSLNARNGADGYAVFGRVLEGLDVMDAIAASPTESRNGQADVPVEDVLLERAERIQRASIEG